MCRKFILQATWILSFQENIQPVVKEDGYVYSDGTTILGADDKAGLASIIEAIKQIKESNLPHGQIQIIITVERIRLVGAKAIDTRLLDADFGYAVDASKDVGTTVIGAPTQVKIYTTIKGKQPMQAHLKRY